MSSSACQALLPKTFIRRGAAPTRSSINSGLERDDVRQPIFEPAGAYLRGSKGAPASRRGILSLGLDDWARRRIDRKADGPMTLVRFHGGAHGRG
jgi:hypothetical protein